MCQIQNAFIIRSYCVFLYCTLYSFIGLRDEYHIYIYIYMYICIYVYMYIYTHTHTRAREGKKIKRKRERIEVCLSTIKRHDLSSIISFRCLHSLVEGTKPLRRGPFLSSPPLDPFFYQNTPLRNLLFFFDSTGQFFIFFLFLFRSLSLFFFLSEVVHRRTIIDRQR